jgi:hypothetical protein
MAACAAKFEREERKEVFERYLVALNLADELGMRPLVAHRQLGSR